MNYKILDLAGNEVFGKDIYPSFEAADKGLESSLNMLLHYDSPEYEPEEYQETFERVKGEYQIVEVKE